MITTGKSRPAKEESNIRLGPVGLRFRSILVATDRSTANEKAVKLGAELAKEFHAKLHILHAISPEYHSVNLRGPFPELDLVDLEAEKENLHHYLDHIPELRAIKHEEWVSLGFVGEVIQAAAESKGIDLLVLGSHGRQGLAKLTLGSVAEWAIHRLGYPVLVAGPSCDRNVLPLRSIVLASDLSEQSLRPAQYAGNIAQDYNARLTAIHIVPPSGNAEERAERERVAHKRLHEMVPFECNGGCILNPEVRSGETAATILQSAKENKANLLVLGARHKAPLADHIPRTKLSAILRESRCPVLLVPPHRI
jgi:nucleotide-binding universal stress UspA family protein